MISERTRALRADLERMLREEGIVLDSPRVNPQTGVIRMSFDFTDEDFERAIDAYDNDAASLWPSRLPEARPLQLMLVHIQEDLDRIPDKSEVTLRFDAAGYASVSRSGSH